MKKLINIVRCRIIKYIYFFFISKEKVDIIEVDFVKVLEDRYNEYGKKIGIIYITKEEFEQYRYIYIGNIQSTITNVDFLGCKIELDVSILRDEKLKQLGI